MADVFTKEKRSEIMSRIRSKNTLLEKTVFSFLRSNKIYFQKHYKKAPGNPDIALPSKKKAVFIDGDFWHGRKFKIMAKRLPEVYWLEKIQNNIKRDARNRARLRKMSWKILRVWEYDLKKNKSKTLAKIKDFLLD